jgi:hypothetical protein
LPNIFNIEESGELKWGLRTKPFYSTGFKGEKDNGRKNRPEKRACATAGFRY